MLITPRGLLCDVGQGFGDTARPALPSAAEPSWFAPPVDVRGDDQSLTILFHVPEPASELRAESCGRSVILRARLPAKDGGWRVHRAVRVFSLPFEAPRGNVRTVRKGDLVEVHVRRSHGEDRRPARPAELEEAL